MPEVLYTYGEFLDITKRLGNYPICFQFYNYISNNFYNLLIDGGYSASNPADIKACLEKATVDKNGTVVTSLYIVFISLYRPSFTTLPLCLHRKNAPYVQEIYKWRLEVVGK